MNFYKRTQKWKYVLFIVAVIISTLSIYLTRSLENSLEESINSLTLSIDALKKNEKTLKRVEDEKMNIFAKATEQLNNMPNDPDAQGDYSVSIEIVTQNVDIPLILIDECHDILISRNLKIPEDIEKDDEKKKEYTLQVLEIMKKEGDSIFIDVLGEKQKLFYKNSEILDQTREMHEFTKEKQLFTKEILNEMRWYPYYQLSFILLFAILAYLIFNASRKSEQNQVWAGMAKETAHQIGTPLSSLMAWVELLKQKEENKSMTIEMEKDLKRLETITERFSKIGSKAELHDENLKEIIEETVSYMEKRFSKNIEFIQNINLKSEKIMLNKVLLIWVIENICKNAADAMKGEGTLKLECTENDYNIQLLISDTGKGIDRGIIKSLFMPGVTSKKRGWGLGLSLAKRIIEDYHKGKIYVQNSSEQGTTFCIVLPKQS